MSTTLYLEVVHSLMVSHKNILDSAQALIMAMRKLGVDPEEPNNRVSNIIQALINLLCCNIIPHSCSFYSSESLSPDLRR